MIYFDTTSVSSWRHTSGLARVSHRLLEEMGAAAQGAKWPQIGSLAGTGDWILSPELFSEAERPGLTALLERRPCRFAAIYHDAIPIKHPAITWPKSVQRHPSYMKLLARFDHVWAVSTASRDELLGFWQWQGVRNCPPMSVLRLGADWPGIERCPKGPISSTEPPKLVSIGILEPRKNQDVLLDAYQALRSEGLAFELHLVGRVNPYFGPPIAKRVKSLARAWPGLHHHLGMPDQPLASLMRSARATAFPSLAEGCGLPLLESLWMGVPCLCSDIAPLVENAAEGGCWVVPGNTREGWIEAIRTVLTDEKRYEALVAQARSRTLPTWALAARTLLKGLQ